MAAVRSPFSRIKSASRRAGAALAVLVSLGACSKPEPINLGYMGGLSGRVADLGVAGRNGATLAIERRNAAGGINGRPVALISRDDAQDAAAAERAVSELIDLKVVAVIGPMTSSMATAMVNRTNAARVVVMSPTVTTNELTGKDDYFFRVIAPTREYATKAAHYQRKVLGKERFAAIYDIKNRAYTESWLGDFRAAFEASGGKLIRAIPFESGSETSLATVGRDALSLEPDGILIVANSLDAALLAQQLRKLDGGIGLVGSEWTASKRLIEMGGKAVEGMNVSTLVGSEWAATERLIELGGRAVEGMHIAQFIDRQSVKPEYESFRKEYIARFGEEPGFGGLAAFDATNVVLEALARARPSQSLKDSILAIREFQGAQSPIVFDQYGDSFRNTYLTQIRNGQFHVIDSRH